ncbi:hypothetical protein IR010_00710 [Flavobacterium sp. MR2016-29]|uniref:hypothetical protein n=1 Tax=Flavobacterium sp. MR2016-29 TaxID=2783795 RepID=UPI00188D56FA|nr:hypothetical protein [Flavobacterium sp. MR2016-29]MBF4491043.1 hypothetical protein [Flavobacterium sp. MR2016-29]
MGFFKKIGTAIKKNVSFKNLVKIATPVMGAIPFVGGAVQNLSQGLQDAHELKKAGKAADAEALKQATLSYAGEQVGAVANAGMQMFTQGVTEGAYAGASVGVQNGLGTIGASVADSTIKAWFKLHWKHILIGLSVIGAIYLLVKHNNNKYPRRRATARRR